MFPKKVTTDLQLVLVILVSVCTVHRAADLGRYHVMLVSVCSDRRAPDAWRHPATDDARHGTRQRHLEARPQD